MTLVVPHTDTLLNPWKNCEILQAEPQNSSTLKKIQVCYTNGFVLLSSRDYSNDVLNLFCRYDDCFSYAGGWSSFVYGCICCPDSRSMRYERSINRYTWSTAWRRGALLFKVIGKWKQCIDCNARGWGFSSSTIAASYKQVLFTFTTTTFILHNVNIISW